MAAIIFTHSLGLVGVVEFDCVETEVHTQSADVTRHPVERGADVTDHSRPGPEELNLSGTITNTPLNARTSDFLLLNPQARVIGDLGMRPALLQIVAKDIGGAFPPMSTTAPGTPASLRGGKVGPRIPFRARTITPIQFTRATRRVVPSGVLSAQVTQASTPRDRVRECYEFLVLLCRTSSPVRVITSLREYEQMLISSVSAPVLKEDSIDFSIQLVGVRFAEVAELTPARRRPLEKRAAPSAVSKTTDAPAPAPAPAPGPNFTFADPDRAASFYRDFLESTRP